MEEEYKKSKSLCKSISIDCICPCVCF